MSSIKRFVFVLTLIAAFTFIAGNVESAFAAQDDLAESGIGSIFATPAADDPTPAPDSGCEALVPWMTETDANIDKVRKLYKELDDAALVSPEAGLAALDELAYQMGKLVVEMIEATVPDAAKETQQALITRLDDVAQAYADLMDAVYDQDQPLVAKLLGDIPNLERQLIRAVSDFETMAEECGFDLEG